MFNLRNLLRLPQSLKHSLTHTASYQALSSPNGDAPTMPLRLVLQVLAIQLFYYTTAFLLIGMVALLLGWVGADPAFSVEWILAPSVILRSISNTRTLTLIGCWCLIDVLTVCFMSLILQSRSKIVWDLALSLHIINVLVDWFYLGTFPSLWTDTEWWIWELVSCGAMILASVLLSRWSEVREGFFDGLLDTPAKTPRQPDIEMGVVTTSQQ
ncbi:hypothetical protein BABINDRAFT_40784 [Babjeviella inositovora NRRL Y-12698]|uniref:Protein SYS1 n=1 Tax=Babjeviella inositovora NRRL Y-12698 TaxID=984486 RepID=A0A1E3QLG3_9ASCO|nr:uncharacterized protein BABINDRAFT_40784 [Babjeviella inositovora NRRL Y-12698]ODQ77922.1 hypothetical protein BABINDRAFT_40784 [Babjeviella inositovora NRRL Y-12698]